MGVCLSIFRNKKAAKGAEAGPANGHRHHHFLHRLTKHDCLHHLVRHRRRHRFDATDRFGLDGSYETLRTIGHGGTGAVALAKDRTPSSHRGMLVAIKLQQRPLSEVQATMAFNETVFQGDVGNSSAFITPLLEADLTPTHEAQVMPYMGGGNLAEFVAERVVAAPSPVDLAVPEDEARFLLRQILAGVAFMHTHGIAHRDIKLDNILLDGDGNGAPAGPPRLKLADFQFVYSTRTAPSSNLHLGTPVCMAPELLQVRFRPGERHSYDPLQADVWACGVVLAAMLVGAFPFDHTPGVVAEDAEREMLAAIEAGPWRSSPLVQPYLRVMGPGVKDLLDKMLEPDPGRRITVAGARLHPWVRAPLPEPMEAAWRELEAADAAAARRAAAQVIDPQLLQRRDEAVWAMMQAAREAHGREGLKAGEDAGLIDLKTIPEGARIDMRAPVTAGRRKEAELSTNRVTASERKKVQQQQ